MLFRSRLRNTWNGLGFKSADDVFRNIEEGKQQIKETGVSSRERSSLRPEEEKKNEATRFEQPAVRPSTGGREGIGEGNAGLGDRGGREEARGNAPLAGAPVIEGASGPDTGLTDVAKGYLDKIGLPHERQKSYVDVNEERARRIAQAYEEMEHNPNDPKVKEAYDDLIRQTKNQYQALKDAGYDFTFFDEKTDPYEGNPWNAMRDLRNNKHMAVYGTYDGFGTEGLTDRAVQDNPLLADTGIKWKDQNGVEHPVTANDLFRAVHDAFGHSIEGAGFRARGEENAWQAHARMFTEPGLGALTSETRGQNSWLNYGPYGEKNRTAKVGDTVFADRKSTRLNSSHIPLSRMPSSA